MCLVDFALTDKFNVCTLSFHDHSTAKFLNEYLKLKNQFHFMTLIKRFTQHKAAGH